MAGAASDASAVPIKNRDFRVYFSVYSGTALVSSIDTPDSERSLDGGDAADCSNEAVAITGMDGRHYLDLNASEMNTYWTGVQVEGANCDPTHINLYPQTTDINGLEDFVSDIYSDTTLIVPKTSDTHSRLVIVETALDSDQLQTENLVSSANNYASDAVKTLDSQYLIVEDFLSDIYSDTVLILAKASDTHSRLVIVETALDSDALVISNLVSSANNYASDAVVDIGTLDSAVDSQHVILGDFASDTYSHLLVVETALDSDQVQTENAVSDVHSRLVVMETANDSDQVIISDQLDALDATVAASGRRVYVKQTTVRGS